MALTGTFTATGVPQYVFYAAKGDFNFSLWGTFVGTVQLERSLDAGQTWQALTALGTSIPFSGPCSEVFSEPESATYYRPNCTSYTSGTINYRLSQ